MINAPILNPYNSPYSSPYRPLQRNPILIIKAPILRRCTQEADPELFKCSPVLPFLPRASDCTLLCHVGSSLN